MSFLEGVFGLIKMLVGMAWYSWWKNQQARLTRVFRKEQVKWTKE